MTRPHTFIDLFSGCGGLSLGFEMAGFEGLCAIDCWQDALDTYAFNRTKANTVCGDISEIDPADIKEKYGITDVDVIIGGLRVRVFRWQASELSKISGMNCTSRLSVLSTTFVRGHLLWKTCRIF